MHLEIREALIAKILQETTALISQANFEFGFAANFQASIESTNEAIKLNTELISIAT